MGELAAVGFGGVCALLAMYFGPEIADKLRVRRIQRQIRRQELEQ